MNGIHEVTSSILVGSTDAEFFAELEGDYAPFAGAPRLFKKKGETDEVLGLCGCIPPSHGSPVDK